MNFSGMEGPEQRLEKDLDGLGKFNRVAEGGIMRPALSQAALPARARLREAMRDAGSGAPEGAVARIIGRLNRELDWGHPPCTSFGSHRDTVPQGREFDGALSICEAADQAAAMIGAIRWRGRRDPPSPFLPKD